MKYVLITGAYGGMGRSTAELLRTQGYGIFAMDNKTGFEIINKMMILRSK